MSLTDDQKEKLNRDIEAEKKLKEIKNELRLKGLFKVQLENKELVNLIYPGFYLYVRGVDYKKGKITLILPED